MRPLGGDPPGNVDYAMKGFADSILAQSGLDDLGVPLWVIGMLLISLISWIAGKLKERNERGDPRPPPPPRQPEADRHEPVVDLRTLLGLPPVAQEAPRPTPAVAAPRRVARPAPPPADRLAPSPSKPAVRVPSASKPRPTPPPRRTDARTQPWVQHFTSARTPAPVRARAKRRARVTRAELRRAVILAEVLDKPVALRDLEG